MIFADRRDAGRQLGRALAAHRLPDPLVVALPRGGVPVAFEVARALDAPLEVLVVRKLGAPGQEELGIGAIAEGGAVVLDEATARAVGVTAATLTPIVDRELRELTRRIARYRGGAAPADVRGRLVVLVDDGIATGVTDAVAARALREMGAARIVLAVPVGPGESLERLAAEVDEVVCLQRPRPFMGVGRWYDDFSPTSDEEVLELLAATARVTRPAGARDPAPSAPAADPPPAVPHRAVRIPLHDAVLTGDVRLPSPAKGLVLFAHGSGSSRLSPRNVAVAEALARRGLASLLFDLLTPEEADVRMNVFDVERLGDRLVGAARWAVAQPDLAGLPLGFFGASTGAAAALRAAAALDGAASAVVSRGGRADLAGDRLTRVTAPTLLIVGGADHNVLALNRAAARLLRCPHRVAIVPGAGHLFEEPGALEAVERLAGEWFEHHLTARAVGDPVTIPAGA